MIFYKETPMKKPFIILTLSLFLYSAADEKPNFLETLPYEILSRVFGNLPRQDLKSLSTVSKKTHEHLIAYKNKVEAEIKNTMFSKSIKLNGIDQTVNFGSIVSVHPVDKSCYSDPRFNKHKLIRNVFRKIVTPILAPKLPESILISHYQCDDLFDLYPDCKRINLAKALSLYLHNVLKTEEYRDFDEELTTIALQNIFADYAIYFTGDCISLGEITWLKELLNDIKTNYSWLESSSKTPYKVVSESRLKHLIEQNPGLSEENPQLDAASLLPMAKGSTLLIDFDRVNDNHWLPLDSPLYTGKQDGDAHMFYQGNYPISVYLNAIGIHDLIFSNTANNLSIIAHNFLTCQDVPIHSVALVGCDILTEVGVKFLCNLNEIRDIKIRSLANLKNVFPRFLQDRSPGLKISLPHTPKLENPLDAFSMLGLAHKVNIENSFESFMRFCKNIRQIPDRCMMMFGGNQPFKTFNVSEFFPKLQSIGQSCFGIFESIEVVDFSGLGALNIAGENLFHTSPQLKKVIVNSQNQQAIVQALRSRLNNGLPLEIIVKDN